MELFGLGIIIAVVVIVLVARRVSTKRHSMGPQISISNIRFDPPQGNSVLSHVPITVTFDYKYENSEQPLYVWAKISSEDSNSSYQGSSDNLTPGGGELSRYFYLKQAGKIESINIEVKDHDFEMVFSQSVDASYEITTNDEMEALAKDGLGSKITSVSLNIEEPCVVPVGTNVYVTIEYDIDADAGLDLWAIPVTDCQMTYEGSQDKLNGKGVITKGFVIDEKCQLRMVRLVMENAAGETVFNTQVEVDIQFEGVPS